MLIRYYNILNHFSLVELEQEMKLMFTNQCEALDRKHLFRASSANAVCFQ